MQNSEYEIDDHLYGDLIAEKVMHEFPETIQKTSTGSSKPEVFNCFVLEKHHTVYRLPVSKKDEKRNDQIKNGIKNLKNIRSITTKPSAIPTFHGYFRYTLDSNHIIYYLVFDRFQQTLREFIQKQKSLSDHLPFKTFESLFKNLLHGMTFLQSKNISHMVINLDNVMLDKDDILKIVDDGLVRNHEVEPDNKRAEFEDNDKLHPFRVGVYRFAYIMMELAMIGELKHNQNIVDQVQLIKKIYKNEDVEYILLILERCLSADINERPDFIQIFKRTIGCGIDGIDKIQFYIMVDQMSIEKCFQLFGNKFPQNKNELTLELQEELNKMTM